MVELQFFHLYDQGVKNGSKIFCCFPIFTMAIAIVFQIIDINTYLNYRLEYVDCKIEYRLLSTQLALAYIFMFVVYFGLTFNDSWIWFLFATFCLGYFVFIFCTVPYLMLNDFRKNPEYPANRGLSYDVSLLTASICLGQLISSFIIGHLIEANRSSRIISPYIVILSFCGFVYTLFVMDFPPSSNKLPMSHRLWLIFDFE